MRLTARADLNVGLICNIKCRFCYDLDHLNHEKGPSLEVLRQRMVILKSHGVDTIDITGGEATVRNDLISIIRMVKEEFDIKKICLITNGFKLANSLYLKQVIDAGVNEFLFSIHGPSSDLHDHLVDVKGSFERVIKALSEASRLGVKLRVNTVVTAKNYDKVSEIAAMVSPFKIENFNLILLNPILDARHRAHELSVKYSVAAPFLKDAIDKYAHCFEYFHVKFIPLCFMQGYEKHVMNLVQTSYIPYEWNYCLRTRLRRGKAIFGVATLAGLILRIDLRALWGRSFQEITRDAFLSLQESGNKVKPLKCNSCKFSLICPGVCHVYKQAFGIDELIPVKGKKISSPCHFYEQGHINSL